MPLILVNGLPGAGKTTLATHLAPALGLPLIAKDALKEAMAAAAPDVPPAAVGIAASQAMWVLAAGLNGDAILESWWFRPRDLAYVTEGIRQCGSPDTVEIWCDVPAEVALARCRQRKRPPPYEDHDRLTHHWPHWAAQARPLAVGPVITVRTDTPVDAYSLAAAVRR